MATTVDYTSDLIGTLYVLLCAKYTNDRIASDDETQFKRKVFSIIFQYGPTWKTRLKIQEKLFNLDPDSDDVQQGTIKYYNSAANPDTAPATDAYQTLQGINSQNTSLFKRGKLEGYSLLNDLMITDVTEEFIRRFEGLFQNFVGPDGPLWFPLPGTGEEGREDADFANAHIPNYRHPRFIDVWETVEDFKYDYEHIGIPTTI